MNESSIQNLISINEKTSNFLKDGLFSPDKRIIQRNIHEKINHNQAPYMIFIANLFILFFTDHKILTKNTLILSLNVNLYFIAMYFLNVYNNILTFTSIPSLIFYMISHALLMVLINTVQDFLINTFLNTYNDNQEKLDAFKYKIDFLLDIIITYQYFYTTLYKESLKNNKITQDGKEYLNKTPEVETNLKELN